MEEAEKLCDRIAIIDHGKIVALDSPDNLKHTVGGDIVLIKGKNLFQEEMKKLPFVKNIEKIAAVQFGSMKLKPTGEEIGTIKPGTF
jgi:ABC-type multidrug transport system ATPase subunit